MWLARELLAEVYAATELAQATRRLIVFFQHAADAQIPELCRLARTTDRWRDEVLAFYTTAGASNGPSEAVNLLVEKIQRIGHGYRNFTNYRRRLLLGCGIQWATAPTRRIRGRSRGDSFDNAMAESFPGSTSGSSFISKVLGGASTTSSSPR